MKQITSGLTIPSTQCEQDSPSEQDSTRPDKVWLQLVEIYGKSFFREFGQVPGHLWIVAINKLTDREISRGLTSLAEQDLSFPPNLPRFVAACGKVIRAAHWDVPQLPAPTADENKANADKAWADMEALAGKPLRPETTKRTTHDCYTDG